MSKLTDKFVVVAGFISGLLTILLFSSTSLAVSSSDWNPGRIMDDGVFFNSSSMSATDIQNFLNSNMPTCNTNHARSGSANDSGPPYTCLKNYSENPTTHQNNGNAGGGSSVPGGWSAAQIIKHAADTYGISPKALIVLLQKEQSLITDDWPWAIQYRSATGYGCPDTAPCDAEYYGLYNQVMNAARQFKRYATNSSEYRYKALQDNFIQWNPNASCGGSNVGIQNQTTAGLYNYTPYQPNGAALANLYGTGDGCSAYGNRNFWRIYSDWFGSTLAAPVETPANKAGEGGGNAASWAPTRLDLSVQGTNSTGANTYTKSFDTFIGWGDYEQDSSDNGSRRVSSQIASTSWGPGRIDIFARSESNTLIHKWYIQYVGWSDWEDLGGCISNTPTVTSWGVNRLDILVQGCNENGPNMYHKWWSEDRWHSWELVPAMNTRITSAPSATSWGPGRIDIFARSESGELIHNWYDGRWHGAESLGGCIVNKPAVAAWSASRLDIFVRGCNSTGANVYHKAYDTNRWAAWELNPNSQGTRVSLIVGAVSWSNNRIDVFGRGEDATLMHQWWDGGWSTWESLGGSLASP